MKPGASLPCSQDIPFRSIFILTSHLRRVLPGRRVPSGFTNKIFHVFIFTIFVTCPAHLILLDLITLTIYAAPPASKYFLPLRPKVYPSALLSDTSNILPLT